MFRFIPLLAACARSPAALAQAIYKGSIENKVSYGDRPCPRGSSLARNPRERLEAARLKARRQAEALAVECPA